jgi:predicted N-formylglutamate amidohydrolase
MKLVLTAEHVTAHIPKSYINLFRNDLEVLSTHKAVDFGSLFLYETLKPLAFYARKQVVSRLLIETNRSLHHRNLFSDYSKVLKAHQREELIKQYYTPYRETIQQVIYDEIRQEKPVLHLSLHTFTPVLNGQVRNADIGLLYNPSRYQEKEFAKGFKNQIKAISPQYTVRYNYPYRGTADGFTTALRKEFNTSLYLGIELEVNQKIFLQNYFGLGLGETLYRIIAGFIIR